MNTPNKHTNLRGRQAELLYYLLTLTGFLVLLELSFFLQCNRAYLSDYQFMTQHLQLPWAMLPGVVFFIFAQVLVHAGYAVLIWLLSIGLACASNCAADKFITLGITLWCVGIFFVVAANQAYFPNSKFAELSGIFLSARVAEAAALFGGYVFTVLCLAILLLRYRVFLLLIVLAGMARYGYVHLNKPVIHDAATEMQPNIILVGVDSLRPDYLGYFGSNFQTPFMDAFLDRATVFSEAMTPLARTFPSWTSLLTGMHPRHMGVRTNLVEEESVVTAKTLPNLLRQAGYETLYATDETRFSNIDSYFGFDRVVTPPMGLDDFLLGAFNDFPLSNLLVNTTLGQWLFPHSYANRPVYFTYQPDSFLNLVKPSLLHSRSKPLFMAIHFCLPHHPYLWAGLAASRYQPVERYGMSVMRVDRQLADFFALLQAAHLLDHAIVVLLSDHGEALELSGDRITEAGSYVAHGLKKPPVFYPAGVDKMTINQTVGHGTDVLSINQYHTLLAFRLYGAGPQFKGVRSGAVSLLDIKPTLLSFLKTNQVLRNSLLPLIRNQIAPSVAMRHIFIESDFTPEAIQTVYPETRDVVLEGIRLFQIDPKTTRLTVKKEMQRMIIKSKQYADIYGDWVLALYPQKDGSRMPILVNLQTGRWTEDLHSDFAKHSPSENMLLAMRSFYGKEIGLVTPSIKVQGKG